jgi:aspartyl protease family protein
VKAESARVDYSRRDANGRVKTVFLLFWIAIAVVAYFGMDALVKPRVANVTISTGGGGEIVVPRSRDGHYYVAGAINGHPTTFMVDTGASTIAIDPAVARAAKLPKGLPATFNTASGQAAGEVVTTQSVSVGGFQFGALRIAVIDGVGEYGLLGQNVLRDLEVIQSGDQMILRAKQQPEGQR